MKKLKLLKTLFFYIYLLFDCVEQQLQCATSLDAPGGNPELFKITCKKSKFLSYKFYIWVVQGKIAKYKISKSFYSVSKTYNLWKNLELDNLDNKNL